MFMIRCNSKGIMGDCTEGANFDCIVCQGGKLRVDATQAIPEAHCYEPDAVDTQFSDQCL